MMKLRYVLWTALALALGACQPQTVPGGEPGAPAVNEAAAPGAGEGDAAPEAVATVYFADKDLERLEPEARVLPKADLPAAEAARFAAEELLAGPQETGHQALLPATAKVLGVTVDSGLATVDFNQAFVDDFKGGSGVTNLAIYSIVNSVATAPGVSRVKLTVEGKPVGDFHGHVDLSEPLEPDETLVGGEKL